MGTSFSVVLSKTRIISNGAAQGGSHLMRQVGVFSFAFMGVVDHSGNLELWVLEQMHEGNIMRINIWASTNCRYVDYTANQAPVDPVKMCFIV